MAWAVILSAAAVSHFVKGHFDTHYRLVCGALAVFLIGSVRPALLKPLVYVLRMILHGIVFASTRAVLIVLFYCMITPIGLLMRLSGKDILDKKTDEEVNSYWKEREEPVATKEGLEKQF